MGTGGGGGGVGGVGKVQNIWGEGARGAILFSGYKLIGVTTSNQCQIITFLTFKTDNLAKLPE